MPLKRRWKIATFCILLSISLFILFLPFNGTQEFRFIEYVNTVTEEKGTSRSEYFSTPWRSHDFKLHIFANVSSGKISFMFLDRENDLNEMMGLNFSYSLELTNITGLFNETYNIDPDLGANGLVYLKVEENATFFFDLTLTYIFYMTNYGLVFSGITCAILIVFAIQIKKKSF
jgi:hypothetical protein